MDGCWIDAAGLDGWMDAGLDGWMDAVIPLGSPKDCIPALRACIPIAFLSCSSTFLCAHPYGIPALSACIPTMLQHSLHAFLLHFIISQHSPLCALLLCSSTVGVHFYCIAALFACFSIIPQYYIPALYACIFIIFKYFSGCIYTRLYVFHSMRAFHSSFLKEMETLRDPLVGDP